MPKGGFSFLVIVELEFLYYSSLNFDPLKITETPVTGPLLPDFIPTRM